MKAVITESSVPAETTYPYLAKYSMANDMHKELRVLFVEPRKGLVLAASETEFARHNVGDFRTDWIEESFVRIHGNVNLDF